MEEKVVRKLQFNLSHCHIWLPAMLNTNHLARLLDKTRSITGSQDKSGTRDIVSFFLVNFWTISTTMLTLSRWALSSNWITWDSFTITNFRMWMNWSPCSSNVSLLCEYKVKNRSGWGKTTYWRCTFIRWARHTCSCKHRAVSPWLNSAPSRRRMSFF